MFRIASASKKALHDLQFESNKCNFFMRIKGEIFASRIYIYSAYELNSLAILLSGVDREQKEN